MDAFLKVVQTLEARDRGSDRDPRRVLRPKAPPPLPPADAVAAEGLVVPAVAGIPDNLLQLAAVERPQRGVVQYRQRSDELMEHARAAQQLKRTIRERDEAEAQRDRVKLQLCVVEADSSLSKASCLTPPQLAMMKLRVASTGARKGISWNQRSIAAGASCQVAHCLRRKTEQGAENKGSKSFRVRRGGALPPLKKNSMAATRYIYIYIYIYM